MADYGSESEPDPAQGRTSNVATSGVGFEPKGIPETTKAVKEMTGAFREFFDYMKEKSSGSGAQIASGFSNVLQNMRGSMTSSGGYLTPPNYAPGLLQENRGAVDSSMGGITNALGSGSLAGIVTSIMTGGITYAFNRIEQNRETARLLSSDLGRVSTMSGKSIENILKGLTERVPVLGNPEEITDAMSQGATQGYFDLNSPRSGAYFTGIRQMQQFNPAATAGETAKQLSSSLGNIKSQQMSMMLTGGAMGMFGAGGVPKTLQEWAESTLRWFESQRPGKNRGKAFTKEELTSQVFPGSNMMAWFAQTGVAPEMQDYFWQYAIGKVQSGKLDSKGDTTVEEIIEQRGGDLRLATKATETARARRDFTLMTYEGAIGPSSLYDAYMTRESSDRWMQNSLSQTLDKGLGTLLGGHLGELWGRLPTPIASMFQSLLSGLPNMLGLAQGNVQSGISSGIQGAGDPEFGLGDPGGGYGPLGGTGTAGMTPDMAKRISAMMQANPNIRINSGFRDGALQGRLHSKGVGMTAPAGKSMHGRGLAADLGPASQYGWIAKNAGRFGLASGKSHGEPWHVGFPGTLPGKNFMTGDPEFHVGDISDLFGAVTGSPLNPANWWNGIQNIGGSVWDKLGDGVSNILGGIKSFGTNLFQGGVSLLKGDWAALFGEGGGLDVGSMAESVLSGLFNLMGIPQLLNPLAIASGKAGEGASAKDFSLAFSNVLSGGGQGGLIKPILKSTMDWDVASGTAGATGASLTGMGGGPTGAAVPASVAQILAKWGGGASYAPASVAGHEGGIRQALAAAQAAGFSGDALIAIASIAGRESGWNASAHGTTKPPKYPAANSPMSGDRGMWQINYTHDPKLVEAGIIPSNDPAGKRALMDVNTNAKAAFWLSKDGSNLGAWAYGPGGWGKGPPLYNAGQYVQPVYDLAKQWGFIGDPEYSPAYRPMGGASAPAININNMITVNGGGSNASPVNLRRTAEQLAAFTEVEIRKQMARST